MNKIINDLKKLDEIGQKQYILNRCKELESEVIKSEDLSDFHKGFISKETMIKPIEDCIIFYTMSGLDYKYLIDNVINSESDIDILLGVTAACKKFNGISQKKQFSVCKN